MVGQSTGLHSIQVVMGFTYSKSICRHKVFDISPTKKGSGETKSAPSVHGCTYKYSVHRQTTHSWL